MHEAVPAEAAKLLAAFSSIDSHSAQQPWPTEPCLQQSLCCQSLQPTALERYEVLHGVPESSPPASPPALSARAPAGPHY